MRRTGLLGCFGMLCLLLPLSGQAQVCNVDSYNLPADIPLPNSTATASTFQEFSWNSFLGLNATQVGGLPDPTDQASPQWENWSSTVDMLSCTVTPTPAGCECPGGDCNTSGARYFPTACRGIPNYNQYRVLDQVAKVDDSFLQAQTRGVSNDPVIDRFGNFLRFEILLSPATYNNVVTDNLFDQAHLKTLTDDVNMWCGSPDYTGGDPANPEMGAMVLKAAWMDVENPAVASSLDLTTYHTEDLLVYTPSYRNSSGVESCEVHQMALVGMHIEHKTLRQPAWIWSTFEHQDNAPSCTDVLDAPQPGTAGPNTACPTIVSQDYNFYAMECNNDGGSCASCNAGPTSNDPNSLCINPTSQSQTGWCLDQPAAAAAGKSKICRQVPVIQDPSAPLPNPLPTDYPQAAVWNNACVTAMNNKGPSVWANYMLISGQWIKGSALAPEPVPPALPSCVNVATAVAPNVKVAGNGGPLNQDVILPKATIEGGTQRPFLGNSSMESYDRSNCMGCHSKAVMTNNNNDILSTDFMYWLSLEVAAQNANFLSYWLTYAGSQCVDPGQSASTQFYLNGAVQNDVIMPQSFDLVVALQIPVSVPAPVLTAYDSQMTSMPWVMNGVAVEFEVDPSCSSDSCQADVVFPAAAGQKWVQYRTTSPVSITASDALFSALLDYAFDDNQCAALSGANYQIWATDSSQQQYANFVDGDLLSGQFTQLGASPALEDIPVLGRVGFTLLVMLLLLSGGGLIMRLRMR